MKVPVSWLNDFVDTNGISTAELADRLVSGGFEIEEIIYQKDEIQKVFAGKILSIKKHENADSLTVCALDMGKEVLQIVTHAANIAVGDVVPVAVDGALLPGNKTIKSGELRGVKSEGMLCSGGELGLTEDDFVGAGVYGILILPADTVLGTDVNDIFGTNEVILDVAVTANRQDTNSILGIAREVSAVTGRPLTMPDFRYEETAEKASDYIEVENDCYDLCPRYMAKVVKNVKLEKSPEIIRKRLKSVGIRPINNLVDITNYVLTEIGQPMHAFDLSLLSGSKIVVRKAREGEKIVALDDKEYVFASNELAICDAEKPVAIAGIMGGSECSILPTTKNIVFESAKFARDSIRHTSRRLNLRSDSSTRFEKGLDLGTQETGLNRALALMYKYGYGEIVGGVVDRRESEIEEKVITFIPEEVDSVLGISVPKEKMIEILNSLFLDTKESDGILVTTIPVYRDDIVGVNDLAEEIIRIYGYDNLGSTLLAHAHVMKGGYTKEQETMSKMKQMLVGRGAFEIVSYSFVSPKAYSMLGFTDDYIENKTVKIANPIGLDFSVMRTTLAYSMIKTLSVNFLRGNKSARLFEIAKTYIPKQLPLTELPEEKYKLSIGAYGEGEDFYTMKQIVAEQFSVAGIDVDYLPCEKSYMHPGRSAAVVSNGVELGYFGEVLPDVAAKFDVDKRLYIAELDAEYIDQNTVYVRPFIPLSKYQGTERDLALLMGKDMQIKTVLDVIKANGNGILDNVEVFDVYVGGQVPAGMKSVAVKLGFRHLERTLTDMEVNEVIDASLEALKSINVKLR